jgi:hypothetical protein
MPLVAAVHTGLLAYSSGLLADEITFYRDVLPILQRRCQVCHRPGEAAPMAFLTYKDVRPWAKAIREALLTKKMPPWFADPQYGQFRNDRRLPPAEIRTLTDWVDHGAPEGDRKSAPPPLSFVDGWSIGKPDLVVELPRELTIPATGKVEYQYVRVRVGLAEDKWIERIESRPGNPAVVHHIDVLAVGPGTSRFLQMQPGAPYEFPIKPGDLPKGEDDGTAEAYGVDEELIAGFLPGDSAHSLESGRARLLKAGADLVLMMHYTTNGKATTDRSRVGIIFAKEPPRQRARRYIIENFRFRIPPNDPNFKVTSRVFLDSDVILLSLTPHMHFRGKSFTYRAVYPNGRTETLLDVPRYNFNWQLTYELTRPLTLPKGTQIVCTAYYDNSRNNPFNPDPQREVPWGEQTSDEMMSAFIDVAFKTDIDPASIWRRPQYAGQHSERN